MCQVNPCGGPTNIVHGTCGDDNVHISKAEGLAGLLGYYKVVVNGDVQYMTKQQLENTDFRLGDGDDTLVVDADVKADITAHGGEGEDVLIGGGGDDKLYGGSDSDVILGRGGDDCLHGGRGRDYLFGGEGRDTLYGGRGRDYLDGGPGHDHNHGGPGRDTVRFDWADVFHLPFIR
jgi:Ca2+-binding RTX toxin-like protein